MFGFIKRRREERAALERAREYAARLGVVLPDGLTASDAMLYLVREVRARAPRGDVVLRQPLMLPPRTRASAFVRPRDHRRRGR